MSSTQWMFLVAVGIITSGVVTGVVHWYSMRRSKALNRYLDAALLRRQFVVPPRKVAAVVKPKEWVKRKSSRLIEWLESPAGRQLVAPEDRALMVQCGFHGVRGSLMFLVARLTLVVVLPIVLWIWSPSFFVKQPWVWTMAVIALGYLVPKWVLRSIAANRRKRADEELPLLVDLLGLLQGSGQGLDQSLQLIASDFQRVLPVLSRELGLANRLYASGRTRDQAFTRMSEMFKSSHLADLTALLVQIDRHGGAVQEPLRQFGARLREERRMQMKETIGKVTVKMTGVMILTLLPALMVITAGPGFLSMFRALGGLK